MAAVIGIGLYITHRLTGPILRLVSTARVVSSGDLTARSGVKSADEIGILANTFDEMTEKLQRQHLATIRALTSAIDARDPYTAGHSIRVGQMSVMIAKRFDFEETVLSRIEVGGYLHDIGKIGIRDSILLKPGTLTQEERELIEDHPRIGLSILEGVDLGPEVIEFVAAHHERLDGSGYPNKLSGDEVSLVARIAAVSDMYDALTTHRPYRDPMTPDDALSLLRSQAGQALDPDVVKALALILHEWEARRRHEPALRGFRLHDVVVNSVR
jgi:putative nucleotidyltransferase with HDIG domain